MDVRDIVELGFDFYRGRYEGWVEFFVKVRLDFRDFGLRECGKDGKGGSGAFFGKGMLVRYSWLW